MCDNVSTTKQNLRTNTQRKEVFCNEKENDAERKPGEVRGVSVITRVDTSNTAVLSGIMGSSKGST